MPEDDIFYVAQTIGLEQTARLRKGGQLATITAHSAKYDAARLLKAVLVRRDLYRHIRSTFPRMNALTEHFDSPSFWAKFGIQPNGLMAAQQPDVDQDDPAEATVGAEEKGETLSMYECHRPLSLLLTRLSSNAYEATLCKLAGNAIPGKSLDLSTDGEIIKKQIDEAEELYKKDFPLAPVATMMSAHTVRHAAVSGSASGSELEVKVADAAIESSEDYMEKLAAHNKEAATHELTEIRTYLNSRIQWVTDELDSSSIAAKAGKI